MRCLENHDQPRIASFIRDKKVLENYTAFLYFLKGTTLLYAGQEYRNDHVPSLFEKEVISRNMALDISPWLQNMYRIKKDLLSCEDYFIAKADDKNDIAILTRDDNKTVKVGIFSMKARAANVGVDAPDGSYTDHISGETVMVEKGVLHTDGRPVIISWAL
jgi:glycosidase